jgi:putative transposase
LFSDKISQLEKYSISSAKVFEKEIADITKLSSGYVQQCRDKALWMWKSYSELHKKWSKKIGSADKTKNYYQKLLKREPSKPFESKLEQKNKIDIIIDTRTGSLLNDSNNSISDHWIRISTLEKGKKGKLEIPLNPSKFHLKTMSSSEWNYSSMRIVHDSKLNKYHIHLVYEKEIDQIQPSRFVGVDLGISYNISNVLVGDDTINYNKTPNTKLEKLEQLNELIGILQEKKAWRKLRKIRNKRLRVSQQSDFEMVRDFKNTLSIDEMVFVGNPKNIREKHFRGNGDKSHRKRVNSWAFRRIIGILKYKLLELGYPIFEVKESYTSKTCSCCGSKNTDRPKQDTLICKDCGRVSDADLNACINIIKRGCSKNHIQIDPVWIKDATDGLAKTLDDHSYKSVNNEAYSSTAMSS